ncbi:MAG: hypothetical protein KOO60_12950 [Gemmatimonadales bacterium]|nr:hypothetical protein [Gemmatimonadales bacterium]
MTLEDVLSHIPTLEGAGVVVTFTHNADLVEVMGPWSATSVTIDGADTAPGDFFGWEDGEVSNRLFVFPNGNHEYRDLDASGNIFYYETGVVALDGTAIVLTWTRPIDF